MSLQFRVRDGADNELEPEEAEAGSNDATPSINYEPTCMVRFSTSSKCTGHFIRILCSAS
jgi:hypothetical protein